VNPASEPASTDGPTTSDFEPPTSDLETTAEVEGRYHNYVGHQIPWYLRLLWVLFWCFSAWYIIRLLLPALDSELLSPP
jgi:hypothetical protein